MLSENEKPGVREIRSCVFDEHYFVPGTMVTTYMDGYHERTALICDYTNGGSVMRLNEPWKSGECRPYEIMVEDYISGRVTIRRLKEEK